MPQKPITVARRNYMAVICDVTNNSGLPAFVKVEVLERVLNELRPLVDREYDEDLRTYQDSMKAEEGSVEVPDEPEVKEENNADT